jgi:putative transposase
LKKVKTRKDFLHKVSTTISKNHTLVAMQDLKVRNMSAKAGGTLEDPGKNFKQKLGLNRSIFDQSWYIRIILEYKLKKSGGQLIMVPPHHTNQKYPTCGYTHKDNRKTQAEILCQGFGYKNNADIVGAINVLGEGSFVRSHTCEGFGDQRPACEAGIR